MASTAALAPVVFAAEAELSWSVREVFRNIQSDQACQVDNLTDHQSLDDSFLAQGIQAQGEEGDSCQSSN